MATKAERVNGAGLGEYLSEDFLGNTYKNVLSGDSISYEVLVLTAARGRSDGTLARQLVEKIGESGIRFEIGIIFPWEAEDSDGLHTPKRGVELKTWLKSVREELMKKEKVGPNF